MCPKKDDSLHLKFVLVPKKLVSWNHSYHKCTLIVSKRSYFQKFWWGSFNLSFRYLCCYWSNALFATFRVAPESDIDDDLDGSVLSLGLFPGEYLDSSSAMSGSGTNDDRVIFRFEAAWDSSLHNSLLLNRVTPAGETIYMTISAYLEVCSLNSALWISL